MAINTPFTTGAVLTAAQQNSLPFGLAGYAKNTSLSQTVTTLTDITGLSVTFTGVAGRLYRVEGACLLKTTEGTNPLNLIIRDGSNNILGQGIMNAQLANQDYTAYVSMVLTVTGSYTVKISAQRQAGSGTVTASAGPTYPAYISVTDLGQP